MMKLASVVMAIGTIVGGLAKLVGGLIRLWGVVGAAVLMVAAPIAMLVSGFYYNSVGYVIAGGIFSYIFFFSDWGWWRRR
jgi:hypothetical protein